MPSELSQSRRIFRFLLRNHAWNEKFQNQEYQRCLVHCESALERLKQLLYTTANTQPKPSLAKLGGLWRQLEAFAPEGTPSLATFTEYLEQIHHPLQEGVGPWNRLFHALTAQPGWGDKTSALFVKASISIHRGPPALHFLSDAKKAHAPLDHDTLYLPVDSVITHIFKQTGHIRSPTFSSINEFLLSHYSPEEMLIWDDLWYWGYFTQVVRDRTRVSEWNSDKFWGQRASPKAQEADVQRLGKRFISICRNRGASS